MLASSPLVPACGLHRPTILPLQLWTLYLSPEIHLFIRATRLSGCLLKAAPSRVCGPPLWVPAAPPPPTSRPSTEGGGEACARRFSVKAWEVVEISPSYWRRCPPPSPAASAPPACCVSRCFPSLDAPPRSSSDSVCSARKLSPALAVPPPGFCEQVAWCLNQKLCSESVPRGCLASGSLLRASNLLAEAEAH
nr:type III endosome membrane protein TEMP isoform X1 [Camelus dromedarius]